MKYHTIVIDPPWPIKPIVLKNRPNLTKIPYKTMTIDEIENFTINDFADDQCVLFMWTTMTYLPHALKIIEKWGFKYHATMAWSKNNGRTMFGIKRNVEFVLVAYRGKLNLEPRGKAIKAVFEEPTMVHSKKPKIFFEMIVPKTQEPRISIFEREAREGFDIWGDEV